MGISLPRMRMIQMFLLDLCFPNRCPCCGKLIAWNHYLCDGCQLVVEAERNSFCPRCGTAMENCFCDKNLAYDHALVLTAYADAGKFGVLSMKEAKSLHFGRYCGQELGKRILQDSDLREYDAITYVPMTRKKLRRRRINPAAVLAKEISVVTKIPVRQDLLFDRGTGKSQHTLSAKERAENVAHFFAGTADLTHCRILLCDDVLTTGSTLSYCAGLLKSCGAAEVTAVAATSTRFERERKR